MNARHTSKSRGGAILIAATAALAIALLASFGVYSFAGTGDLLAFLAGLPLSLCAAGVLSGWMTLIRMDYGEEDARHRERTSTAPGEVQRGPAATLGHGAATS